MKNAVFIIAIAAMSFMLGSCTITDAAPDNAPQPLEQDTKTSYSYGHADEVYADPDAYAHSTYESLFKIAGGKQQFEGKTVYYAIGLKKNTELNTYTILNFEGGKVPELDADEIVYARGTIEGKGFLSDGTNSVDTLWLKVRDIERDISKAGITAHNKEYTFENAEYTARNDSMFIEILSLGFSQDALMLSTKTFDSNVENFETYYFDIIIHQDGYYAWYEGCNFWVQRNSAGYDNIPFPVMDSKKDMTIDFIPFREDGSLIYEPLSVNIDLGE